MGGITGSTALAQNHIILLYAIDDVPPEEGTLSLTVDTPANGAQIAVSEDLQSGPRGGNLGWISEDAIDPAFSQVAFALEPGAVSDIVQTQYGYHLIKLIEPLRTQTLPYTQVKGDIRYRLRSQAKAAEEERLKSAIDITLYD